MRRFTFLPPFLILFMIFFTVESKAESDSYEYKEPKWSSIITNIPHDFWDYGSTYFRKEQLPMWGSVLASSAILYYYDDKLIHGTQKIGHKWMPDSEDRKFIPFHIFGLPVQMPDNFNTTLYFIGDGWTQAFLNAGFYAYGFGANDLRAKTTAMQITQGLIGMTILTQTLKHITGRQSPKRATSPRGRWRFFAPPDEYSRHVPSFDAYPSGHVATTMTTLTIIAENYEEYRWIRPVGYGLISILGLAMLNNGVHWASDYPLAIALGYGWGKIISMRGRAKKEAGMGGQTAWWERTMILPLVGSEVTGLRLGWTY